MGKPMSSSRSDLQLREDKCEVERVKVTPRIGISKAADWELRYYIEGNGCVSR